MSAPTTHIAASAGSNTLPTSHTLTRHSQISNLALELHNPDVLTEEALADESPAQLQGNSVNCWCRPSLWLAWVCTWLLPGLGMFTESYFIFSTGQIKSIWKVAYAQCWVPYGKAQCPNLIPCTGNYVNTPKTFTPPDPSVCDALGAYREGDMCSEKLIHAISYIEFAGIMLGMMTMGFIAIRVGLKWASVMTISIMGVGAILMTASSGGDYTNLFTMFAASYFIFGYGVGGEYPTAAVGAAERNAEASANHAAGSVEHGGKNVQLQPPRRGFAVQMMFSMQGWGAVVGAAIICIVLAGFKARDPQCVSGNNPQGYKTEHLQATWRILYGLGLIPIIYTLLYRIFRVHEPAGRAAVMAANKDAAMNDPNFVTFPRRLALFLKHYWSRLFGTAMCWFVWDVAFYGNKLFSGPIFSALLGPGSHLLDTNLYILLNNSVALTGYWFAAATIDKSWMGRVRLQNLGFIASGALFLACGIKWNTLSVHLRLFLYLFTSFWGQFGPNATTYVLPSESFPSDVRTIGHGVSAFMGKAGALIATIIFTTLDIRVIFYVCGGCCFGGAVLTWIFCPNLTHLDLDEQEEHWEYIKSGRADEYRGEAIRPRNLSIFERLLGHSKNYTDEPVKGGTGGSKTYYKGAAKASSPHGSSDSGSDERTRM